MTPVKTKTKPPAAPPQPPIIDGPPPKPHSRFRTGEIEGVDYRLMRQQKAGRVAWELHTTPSLKDRITIYKTNLKTILFLAASLYPELVPTLNGEWEFLTLLSADLD
jgi:hypothetical protein